MDNEKSERGAMRVAYYSTMFNSWANTRMEKDKSILIISSAAIGFLMTLATKADLSQPCLVFLYLLDMGFFLASIGVVIYIFSRNSLYIGSIIKAINAGGDKVEEVKDGILAFFDKVLIITFSLGIITFFALGSITILAISRNNVGTEAKMAEENKKVNGDGFLLKGSLDGKYVS